MIGKLAATAFCLWNTSPLRRVASPDAVDRCTVRQAGARVLGRWTIGGSDRWQVAPCAFFVCLAVAVACGSAAAQDVIFLSASNQGTGRIRITGEVLDYTGSQLRVRLADGREQTFPGDRVARIETPTTAEQQEADRRFAAGRYAEALPLYQQARQKESRVWMRRQITAQIVRCCWLLGRTELAGEEFLLLVQSDPETPYFDCIPLAWMPGEPSGALEQAAVGWLRRSQMPAAVLLGASHLLSGPARAEAVARLQQLVLGSDRRVAQLAMAQLWRVQFVTADQGKLLGWEEVVRRMPRGLRAGPYFVLGAAWAQKQQWERAALAWMRVPILHADHRRLAAQALLRAAGALEQLDRPDQAARLYRELVQQYDQMPEAAEATRRLQTAGGGTGQ